MKKIKILLLIITIFITSGCFKKDNLEGINIITSVYPIEYVTNYLYKDHANILSIYPDSTDSNNYLLSEKQLQDFSKNRLFIYNGLSNDKDITMKLLDKNSNMLIIDASYGMEVKNDFSELWLNPSNLLMMSQNIKNGLKEYISNSYLEKEIDKKYEELELSLSELDAEIKLTAENSSRKTIVVNCDTLKYLEKYGFKVISLDDKNTYVSDKTIEEVINLINSKEVKHIFLLEKYENTKSTNDVINKTKIETFTFKKLDTIIDSDRNDNKDFITLMNENIDMLKEELY